MSQQPTLKELETKEFELRRWIQMAAKIWVLAGLPLFVVMALAAFGAFPIGIVANGYLYLGTWYALWAVSILLIALAAYWFAKIRPINRQKGILYGGSVTIEDYNKWLDLVGIKLELAEPFDKLSADRRIQIWKQLNENEEEEE